MLMFCFTLALHMTIRTNAAEMFPFKHPREKSGIWKALRRLMTPDVFGVSSLCPCGFPPGSPISSLVPIACLKRTGYARELRISTCLYTSAWCLQGDESCLTLHTVHTHTESGLFMVVGDNYGKSRNVETLPAMPIKLKYRYFKETGIK